MNTIHNDESPNHGGAGPEASADGPALLRQAREELARRPKPTIKHVREQISGMETARAGLRTVDSMCDGATSATPGNKIEELELKLSEKEQARLNAVKNIRFYQEIVEQERAKTAAAIRERDEALAYVKDLKLTESALGNLIVQIEGENDEFRQNLAASQEREKRLREALEAIQHIPNQADGGDWDEIDLARNIAGVAISETQPTSTNAPQDPENPVADEP